MPAKVFRVMKRDPTVNAPVVESSARGLGVRPADLTPCALGLAHPNRGGMSVAPSLIDLPVHRVPERLGHLVAGATGHDSDRVWTLGDGVFSTGPLSHGLRLSVTSKTHGAVEPDEPRPYSQYEAHLAATASLWMLGEQ